MDEVLRYLLANQKIGRVVIVTNGTMIPSDTTMELLKNEKVIMRISGYGEDVAPRRANLVQMLHTENIPVHDLQGMTWRDIGSTECRHRTKEELEKVWDMCAMNECEGMTSRGRIYFCSRATAADDLECCPRPKEGEYVDVRNTPVDELAEKLEKFYDLSYISTCDYCDGLTDQTPYVPVAAQLVSKAAVLELFQYEFRLKAESAKNELLLKWMEFVAQDFQEFVYEEEVQKALNVTLEAYEHNNPQKALRAWNELNNSLFSRYCFSVENKSDLIQDSWCQKSKYLGKRRNTICILVADGDQADEGSMSKADIILSPEEIMEERRWESETGLKSVLRYAFDFGKMH